ncbi:activity-regulated cytoskeleton associated protein 1-like [Drosophila eugracilis]|uniref:activity-regulated cytoskeleton associated protein 1-like n=1 Tax=Drosophila eugracilis TaxID=29029 RepID=UPI001BD9A2EE|nr:activity-regulated cytoskeleton associated protein 1-like [Drosophila eugracilis]
MTGHGDRMKVETPDRVRSSGIRYHGTSNPLEFLGKMEEWAKGCGINKNALVQAMPFILEGAAEDWWNTAPSRVRTWEELRRKLREYFLPPRYQKQLDVQIGQLRQKEGEPTRTYAMELRKLLRFPDYSEEEKMDRIYKNCRSKIKLYERRSGFSSLTEFLTLAEEVEEVEAAERQEIAIREPQEDLRRKQQEEVVVKTEPSDKEIQTYYGTGNIPVSPGYHHRARNGAVRVRISG